MKKITLLIAVVLSLSMVSMAQNTNGSLDNSLATTLEPAGSISNNVSGTRDLGDVLDQVSPANLQAWGVGFDGQYLYFSDPFGTPGTNGQTVYQYNMDGTATGYTIDASAGSPSWIGDMASDGTLLYCCNVGGDNAINVFNIATGALVNTLTGAWTITSQRGLAYDANNNEFYIGGWNSNQIWHIDATGVTIEVIPFNAVSGLAWNPTGGPSGSGSLWVAVNASGDLVTEIDPNNGWAALQTFVIPNGSDFSGAGLEINSAGNFWVVNQSDEMVYLVDSNSGVASVPVSNWALAIGLLLISGFIVVRFRTKMA